MVRTIELIRKFFINYLWIGIVIVLITIILDLKVTNKTFIFDVAIKLFESIGISVIVASVFTFASGTSQFMTKIKYLLKDIVLSRDFLRGIDRASKVSALNALLKPSSEEDAGGAVAGRGTSG